MSTPEHKIKTKVNKVLAHWEGVYKFMPVQQGFGAPTLDYLVSVNGHFLGIETKAPGKKPTPRQLETIKQITAAGGTAIVIDGDMAELNAFLNTHTTRKYPISPEDARRAKLKNRHGITPEHYNQMLINQNGSCFFCTRTPAQEPYGVLCIDHDHDTKRIRGLVCRAHNHALWHFGDTIAGFEKALAYLQGPDASNSQPSK
jgi:hypothetical protein